MEDITVSIRGTVFKVCEVQTFPSGFRKRTIIIEVEGKWPLFFPVDLLKDDVDIVDKAKITAGSFVTANCIVEGRLNKDGSRAFVDIRVSRGDIVVHRDEQQPAPKRPSLEGVELPTVRDEDGSELPF